MNQLEIGVANLLAQGGAGTIQLGGQTLFVKAPKFSDIETFHRVAMRAKRERETREREESQARLFRSLKEAGADQETIRLAVREALAVQTPKHMTPQELAEETAKALSAEEFNALMMTPEGASLFVWCCTREAHKELTYEAVRKWIDPDNYLAVLAEVGHAVGMETASPNGHGGIGTGS